MFKEILNCGGGNYLLKKHRGQFMSS